MQDKVDYLSQERMADYASWKFNILAEIKELESHKLVGE